MRKIWLLETRQKNDVWQPYWALPNYNKALSEVREENRNQRPHHITQFRIEEVILDDEEL